MPDRSPADAVPVPGQIPRTLLTPAAPGLAAFVATCMLLLPSECRMPAESIRVVLFPTRV